MDNKGYYVGTETNRLSSFVVKNGNIEGLVSSTDKTKWLKFVSIGDAEIASNYTGWKIIPEN